MKEKQLRVRTDYVQLKEKAYDLVVVHGYSQKEASEILSLSEKTLSQWAIQGGWKEERESLENINFQEFIKEKLRDLLADIAQIEDKELRVRIANKLTGRV